MSNATLYPPSPANIPDEISRPNGRYKRQAWLAMTGLLGFMAIYIALLGCFAMIAYSNILLINQGSAGVGAILLAVTSSLLTVFMAKSLFSVRKSGNPGGIEVTEQQEPKLYEFLHRLAEEVGAPKPHRVFITPEVNAAVFYDLSLINLIFPSKKNLIVGLGLVNVLNLGELKAVLAHEFGHFAQGSMMVGRWVYIAQQIIAHMVATRDWLDSVVRFVSRIDLRIAWIGWILALVIWSIRSLMDTLFRVVVIAERALSREMEFNADLVAVSVTGSDALVNALHKLQAADDAWQNALHLAESEAGKGKILDDLFDAQKGTIQAIGKVLGERHYGSVPERPQGIDASAHRVFTEEMARPPQMWSTHPANRDREDNAKHNYLAADIDGRDSWVIFDNPAELRKAISRNFYNSDKVGELEPVSSLDAVSARFSRPSYSSRYRGTYLSRSTVRNFDSIEEILGSGEISTSASASLASLYPEKLTEQLELARNLDLERDTLQALTRGELKPSGGVIRHRGNELKKSDIPSAIQQIAQERTAVADHLKIHDASCRRAHLQAAQELGQGWEAYLLGLIQLLHCVEHLNATVQNEQARLVNTWQIITADGQIGYFEKKRILKVCTEAQQKLREISASAVKIELPTTIIEAIGIGNWADECPTFDLPDANKSNWGEWCPAASKVMANMSHALGIVQSELLEELIRSEELVAGHLQNKTIENVIVDAPAPGKGAPSYPTLKPGDEHGLQHKLDFWNRFQLAQGAVPTVLRLAVSIGIVGGTIYSGLSFA